MKFFTTMGQGQCGTKNFQETEIATIIGASIKPHQYDDLNVIKFNLKLFDIIKQIYFVTYRYHFGTEPMYIMDLYNIQATSEPIIHIPDQKYKIIHGFSYSNIAKYFNNNTHINILETIDQSTTHFTMRDDATFTRGTDNNIEEDLRCIRINKLQSINLIKLYVACDHAIEHLAINNEDPTLENCDPNHKLFGKNVKFLSSLFSYEKTKDIDYLLKPTIASDFKRMYQRS